MSSPIMIVSSRVRDSTSIVEAPYLDA